MNVIEPASIKYVLWSEDESFSNSMLLNKNEFDSLLTKVELKNDLLAYGNVSLLDGKHNMLLETKENTLQSHAKINRWYTTWFIDDNNDLWCRDDTFCDGVNYYLFREFDTNNNQTIFTIKTSLSLDLETLDSDMIFDNTNDIGSNIIDILNLDREHLAVDVQNNDLVNAYDMTYMTMLINQELDNVLSNYIFDLDILTEKLKDCLSAWYSYDNSNNNNQTTIHSMIDFIDSRKSLILSHLNEACQDQIDMENQSEYIKSKGKEL